MKISLVIPLFNEEDNITELYEALTMQSGYEWEAFLVNDGSSDTTGQRIEEIASRDIRIKVIEFRKNYGQTAAMSAGFNHATGDVIVPMDGDLQNDPADIPLLLEKINEGYDVVSGWRKNRQDKTVSRKIPSKIANALISKITKVHLHDYGCSLKAYKKDILKDVKLYGEMHRFIPAYAAWHGARVCEVVVNHRPRVHGKTKYGIGRTLKVVLDLLTVKFLIDYSTRPMHFFGKVGLWSFLVSFASGLLAFYYKFSGEKSLIETPLPLVSALFFIVGIQFLLMGLLAEMLTRNYHESVKKNPYSVKSTFNI